MRFIVGAEGKEGDKSKTNGYVVCSYFFLLFLRLLNDQQKSVSQTGVALQE